ncbi:putative holin [Xanthomonas phage Pfeifenkraut]|uniref:Holin n=1 Tax=Xanthomonas phage Pfeifenkraut TaxID=2939132 RepID=A0A9E7E1M0_9CAUD|nr:putative holin [Xanthomonas phage Pfeifenkraut]URA06933.1 putative holin [Xanthomonas phage Pfeifenkraut]
MHVDQQQVAVLVDRVNTLVTDSKEMRQSLENIRISLAKIEQVPAELAALRIQVEAQAKVIDQHKFIVKLMGTVLLTCVGLIGWGWREGKALYATDAAADRRLLMIEYKLNIPPPAAEGDKQ